MNEVNVIIGVTKDEKLRLGKGEGLQYSGNFIFSRLELKESSRT